MEHYQSSDSSDSFYVRSHFRKRSKSVPSSLLKENTFTKPTTIGQHLMDPATFKLVLDTQKQNLADAKENRKSNKSNVLHKNEWKTFFSTKKKKRRGKAKFVWEVKKIQQHKAEMEFIQSIHNLKIPMDADQYDTSDRKQVIVIDHKKPTPMDVDSDSESETEGDETMTIASLVNETNIDIDSPKQNNHDEQQTQMESPTQLFQDSDDSDDDGEFLFEE